MTQATLITACFPVVIVVGPRHWEPGWVESLDRQLREVYARRSRFALITDTRPITGIPGAKERKPLVDWLSRPEQLALVKQWNVGSSTILDNALMRGALQAIYWLWTPASPQHAAADFDQAWSWCIQQLSDAGVALPASPSELREIARHEMERAVKSTGAWPTAR